MRRKKQVGNFAVFFVVTRFVDRLCNESEHLNPFYDDIELGHSILEGTSRHMNLLFNDNFFNEITVLVSWQNSTIITRIQTFSRYLLRH